MEKEDKGYSPQEVLTIQADGKVGSARDVEDANWHEVVNATRTKKVLTGKLSGIEKLDGGWIVAVVYYKGFWVVIPIDEMNINLSGDGRESSNMLTRQVRIANNMLGCEIDFIVAKLDEESRSIVASRKEAMYKKRQMFFLDKGEGGSPMVHVGRTVEARIIAVAEKVVRLEVFGVELSVRARDMAWEWMADASEKFSIGDLVIVRVTGIEGESVEDLKVTVDAKSTNFNHNKANLARCQRQAKYVGTVTDVYKGTYFVRLNNGVNAVAHSCAVASLPGIKDEVGFLVTHINEKFEAAEGIITRVIKQGN